jgi:hypothetical protein
MATAAKKKATAAPRSVAKTAASVVDQAGYLVRSHVTINFKGYGVGEVLTDLTEEQATELLAIGVIEKTAAAREEDEPPAD